MAAPLPSYYSRMSSIPNPQEITPDVPMQEALLGSTPGPLRRRYLFLLILFRVSRAVASGMIIVAFPYLVLQTLGYGSFMLSLLYTAGMVSTAVLGLIVGHLTDTWSRKGTLFLTGVMTPVAAIMVYVSHTLGSLFVAAVVGGFAATGSLIGGGVGGAAQPVQGAVIADLTTLQDRTFYYSLLAFLSGVAGAAGALLARYFSTENTFLVGGLIALVGLAAIAPLKLSTRRATRRRVPQSRKAIGKFGITGALNGFSQGLITPFLIPFFVIVYHVSKSHMAVYASAATVLGAASLLTAPVLERRLGFVRSITFTRALGTALLVLMVLWHNLDLALTIYVITPALRIAALPAQQTALTSRVHADDVGRALGINQVARLSAGSAAIVCTGYLFELSYIEAPFFIYAGVMAANIFLYYKFFGKKEEPLAATVAP